MSERSKCYIKLSRVPHRLPPLSGESSPFPFCLPCARHQVGSRKGNPDQRGLFPGWAGEEGCKSYKGENLRLILGTRHYDLVNCQERVEVTLG